MSVYNFVIELLDKFGFFDIIIPFILVYAVVYGVLAKTQLLGDPFDKDQTKAKFVRTLISLISLSIAFLTIGALHVIVRMKEFVSYVSLYLLSVFMLIVSMAIFYLPGEKLEYEEYKKYRKFIFLVSLIVFTILTLFSFGFISAKSLSEGFQYALQSEFIIIIVIFSIIFGVIYFITKTEERTEKAK